MANAQVGAGTPLVHVDAAPRRAADAPGVRVTFEGVDLLEAAARPPRVADAGDPARASRPASAS